MARVKLLSSGGKVAGVVDGEEVARHDAAGAGNGGVQRLYLAPPSLVIKPTNNNSDTELCEENLESVRSNNICRRSGCRVEVRVEDWEGGNTVEKVRDGRRGGQQESEAGDLAQHQ